MANLLEILGTVLILAPLAGMFYLDYQEYKLDREKELASEWVVVEELV